MSQFLLGKTEATKKHEETSSILTLQECSLIWIWPLTSDPERVHCVTEGVVFVGCLCTLPMESYSIMGILRDEMEAKIPTVSNLEAEVSSLDALRSSSSCLTPSATKLKSKILLWTVPMASVE